MLRTTIASTLSVLGATLTLSVQALSAQVASPQAPSPGQAPAPGPTSPARPSPSVVGAQTLTSITLVGCLYKEAAVPGRTPNVAEKAGVLEDYILADATMPADAAKNTTLATGNMYKVENIADDKLRALVGKRVEVAGKIDPEGGALGRPAGGPSPDKGLGPDKVNLPEFEATSIKETTGSCPLVPAARK
jgi:hypothetical protein